MAAHNQRAVYKQPDHPLAFQLAQLRHAYMHLSAERVRNQKEFADGLIAPAIKALEAHIREDCTPVQQDAEVE